MRMRHVPRGALALTAGAPAVLLAAAGPATATPGPPTAARAGAAPIVAWNRELITLLALGAQPATVHPTRGFAILQAAEYDAVVSAAHTGRPYLFTVPAPRATRPDAAADQAAHDVLAALYPAQRPRVDRLLRRLLAAVPDGAAQRAGRRVGAAVAHRMLRLRAHDGSSALVPPPPPGTGPGAYRPTPPDYAAPKYPGLGRVRPFVLRGERRFLPAPPPGVHGRAYAVALDEVMRLGRDTSTARTPAQTAAARFWSGPATETVWNQAAQHLVLAEHAGLARAAAVFARLDLALADTTIVLFRAKYGSYRWRPITAIRLGGTHYNRFVTGDPRWNSLVPTSADPSYPSGHAALSEAAATALTAFYGPRHPVTLTSGTTRRTYRSLWAAAREAGLSRIWAGQHHRYDLQAGRRLGARVARHVAGVLRGG